MIQAIPANNITLFQLEIIYGVELVNDDNFFKEWLKDLPEVIEIEKERLDRVQASYAYLLKYPPLLENTVKMVVLSPLLELAGFYLPPFRIKSEKSIIITFLVCINIFF